MFAEMWGVYHFCEILYILAALGDKYGSDHIKAMQVVLMDLQSLFTVHINFELRIQYNT